VNAKSLVLSFEFRHQPLDLLAASPPPNANLSDFGHADSASKTRAPARWGSSDGYFWTVMFGWMATPSNRLLIFGLADIMASALFQRPAKSKMKIAQRPQANVKPQTVQAPQSDASAAALFLSNLPANPLFRSLSSGVASPLLPAGTKDPKQTPWVFNRGIL
jgi:hypothetical protein